MEISASVLKGIMIQGQVYVIHAIYHANLVQMLVQQTVPLVAPPTIEKKSEIVVFA
jgi:hypothetical protein